MTDRETILAAFRFTLGYAEKLAAAAPRDLAVDDISARANGRAFDSDLADAATTHLQNLAPADSLFVEAELGAIHRGQDACGPPFLYVRIH